MNVIEEKKKGVFCYKNYLGYFFILFGYFFCMLSVVIWSGELREEVCDNLYDM